MDREPQVFKLAQIDGLIDRTHAYKDDGWRLGQICATTEKTSIELLYTFIKGALVENVEFHISEGTVVPSISSIYLEAFFFENEMHDLFGVQFSDVAIDYKGKFIKTSVVTPMDPHSAQAVAAARAAGADVDIHERPNQQREGE